MLTAEQVLSAHKTNVEALFGLTSRAFEGVEKLVELNLQVTRAALTEAQDNTRAVLAAKDVQDLLNVQAGLLQPNAEKAVAYTRHLYEIAVSTNADVVRAAEAQFGDAQKSFANLVETASKNAPAGSENVVALYKSAMSAANNAIESVQKAAKQAADVAAANMNALTENAVKVTKTATAAKKR